MPRQTYFAKNGELSRKTHEFDAAGRPLGRLAAEVAPILMGKHRPEYTPHVDVGDHVIITNAANVELTGRKADRRVKTRFTGYPGGLRTITLGQERAKHPTRLVEDAVRRMLPKTRLGRQMIKKLTVYAGDAPARD